MRGTSAAGLESPRQTRRLNPFVSHAFRQVERLGAVGEHRRVALGAVQTPSIHLGDVSNDLSFTSSVGSHETLQLAEQLAVAHRVERLGCHRLQSLIPAKTDFIIFSRDDVWGGLPHV